jgi:excisionase family DNA binding protein
VFEFFKKAIYLTAPQAAKLLKTTKQNVYDQIKNRNIHAEEIQFGSESRYQIPADRFREYMRQKMVRHERIAAQLRESTKRLEEMIRNA